MIPTWQRCSRRLAGDPLFTLVASHAGGGGVGGGGGMVGASLTLHLLTSLALFLRFRRTSFIPSNVDAEALFLSASIEGEMQTHPGVIVRLEL